MSPTLVHRLAAHAAAQPDRPALTFLVGGETPGPAYTYGELARAVAAGAATLAKSGLKPGDRALLAYPPGLDFVVAFLACLAAGVVAVPTALPRHVAVQGRLQAIGQDAGAAALLTTQEHQAALQGVVAQVLATDGPVDEAAPGALPAAGDLAFLQYTSGSTGTPKGVRVTHANLVANLVTLSEALRTHRGSVFVSWLPLFHDMGLIGVVLQALFVGAHAVLLPPLAFVQKPLRWLRAVSRYGATVTGGPNFAFDLCAKRATPEAIAALDLRTVAIFFSGAEPIHADTLDRFEAAFAPAGFARRMYYPCFGMAEATLYVSGGEPTDLPVVVTTADGRAVVGCGRARPGHAIAIVDPASGLACPEGTEGEIWVRGPSIADGYWERPDATRKTFDGQLAGRGGYMRTGDLGFLQGGELFVSGRLKDMIIVEGRNHYPHDLEHTVEGAHAGVRATSAIAFGVTGRAREEVIVVAELARSGTSAEEEVAVREAVREAVAVHHDLTLKALVLLRGDRVPKTTSGKVMRAACREAYLGGHYAALAPEAPA